MIGRIVICVVSSLFVMSCVGDDWDALRIAAVDRPRPLIYNTDGCDMLQYPSNEPVCVAAFIRQRLAYARNTRISTISYCPQSSGFGRFTCLKAGEPLLGNVPEGDKPVYNAVGAFGALGTDSLQMASEFCRTNGFEIFVSIRINDQHDACSRPDALSALYPKFKQDHPECLMGSIDRGKNGHLFNPGCSWSCVDFTHRLVRERMKEFVGELVENYDIDGIEYDFNRHLILFKSVACGGEASNEELDMMTQLLRDLKNITENAARRKRRPIVISVRTPDSVEYCKAAGVDLERWLGERLCDIWIGGGYFLMNQWKRSVDLAHRYGVKFYASFDDSRVALEAKRRKQPCIPGRMTHPFHAARFSAALASGCDGVYLFNAERHRLQEIAGIRIEDVPGMEKLYFAVDRGSGGYSPWNWVKDGGRFSNMPMIDPGRPLEVSPGERCSMPLFIGDSADGMQRFRIVAKVLTNLSDGERVLVSCNGHAAVSACAMDGLAEALLENGWIKSGMNEFCVTMPTSHRGRLTFNDFAIAMIRKE